MTNCRSSIAEGAWHAGAVAKPMRILSIDGGGIRGLIPAAVLVELETILRERYEEEDQR